MLGILRAVADEPQEPTPERSAALQRLLDAEDKELPPVLHALVEDAELRGAAIRGLAAFDDPKTPEVLLAVYDS